MASLVQDDIERLEQEKIAEAMALLVDASEQHRQLEKWNAGTNARLDAADDADAEQRRYALEVAGDEYDAAEQRREADMYAEEIDANDGASEQRSEFDEADDATTSSSSLVDPSDVDAAEGRREAVTPAMIDAEQRREAGVSAMIEAKQRREAAMSAAKYADQRQNLQETNKAKASLDDAEVTKKGDYVLVIKNPSSLLACFLVPFTLYCIYSYLQR
jgi:hypothetical protein